MGEVTTIQVSLPEMVSRAARMLDSATSAAEVLDARLGAQAAYDAAKIQARIAKAKKAHDEVLDAIRVTRGQALEIEAKASERLADEYDAAQDRGEVAQQGGTGANQHRADVTGENVCSPATVADLGLTRKIIHEARQVRDAEKASPGIVKRTLDGMVQRGEEPTKAAVKEAVQSVLPKPVQTEPEPASNVVQLGPRQSPLPHFGDLAREIVADEARDDALEADDEDVESVDGRAHAFNGALSTLDFIAITGREYWSVFDKDPARTVFLQRAIVAHERLTDIIKEANSGSESNEASKREKPARRGKKASPNRL